MIGQQLGRDISNAQHRILDHREFVRGEIDSFLNEFEAKRDDLEVETFFKVTETVGELKYGLSERSVSLGTANLVQLSTEIQKLLGGVEEYLAKVEKDKPPSGVLEKSRLQRAQKKVDFCSELQHCFQRVDHSFEEKEEEISELYSDLQVKLNIPK